MGNGSERQIYEETINQRFDDPVEVLLLGIDG